MRKAIEAKLTQAEEQLPQWEQRLAEARQAMAAASEQLVRWEAVAQVCSELLSGPECTCAAAGVLHEKTCAASDERQLQKDKVRLVQEMKI